MQLGCNVFCNKATQGCDGSQCTAEPCFELTCPHLLRKCTYHCEVLYAGFLPDTDRDLAIEKAKQELQRQWSEQQEELKQQNIQVPFSYWDGSGHQRSAAVAVGGTIEDFLKVARGVMEKDFPQMRHAAVSNLMVVAHDVMLPQACSFHKLIVGKAQNGKGEVLFELDNQNKSAHSIKVLLRSWYESNKHIYPANRWQLFDEDVHIP